ncbi:MAG TPA: anti-sigma factor [Aestuariivirga sp.]|nr:anti-sigma factor [Aestuariivirga sp.]
MMAMKMIENWALNAYVDGELDAAERDTVEKLLAADAGARETVEAYRRQNQSMKQAYESLLTDPVPGRLAASVAKRDSWARPFMNMAAAILLVIIGAAAGWFAGNKPLAVRAETLAAAAISAHEIYAPEVKHPVEVGASDKDHLQAWLSKRVGVSFTAPDLNEQGYTLLGGRLLVVSNHPAAQLMYEDAGKKRITILLTANAGEDESALRVEHKGAVVACYWLNERLAFALVGEMDEEAMMRLAHVVYDSFES